MVKVITRSRKDQREIDETGCLLCDRFNIGRYGSSDSAVGRVLGPPTPETKSVGAASVAVDGLQPSTIKAAMKYVTDHGGFVSFDAKSAKLLSAADRRNVQHAVDDWNANLKRQTGSGTSSASTNLKAKKPSRVSGKHGYIEARWWDLKIHVDSYLAKKISSCAASAAAIASGIGLASAATGVGGIAAEVVAAALAGASAGVDLCGNKKGAITFYWIVATGVPVCNPLA